ncbi:prepilin type IV pili [Cupriavidus sp. UYMSc13B]|nr:prepilin type IV pili [Cupriavidus sp. UYMSc13B]
MEALLSRIIAFVLGLLALAAVGLAAKAGFDTSKASDVTNGVAMIVTNTRSQFMQSNLGYTNFKTANASSMITAGLFPPSWVVGATVTDPWGNAVAMAPDINVTRGVLTIGGGGSQKKEQCVKVATSLRDYVTLKIGATTFDQTNQPDATSAGAVCADTSTLVITFQ